MPKVPIVHARNGKTEKKFDFATIGFSTRSLVQAAQRAGFRVLSLDAFSDFDCRLAASKAVRIEQWGTKAGVELILNSLQAAEYPPILLGGGTENWISLAEALEESGQVLGPNSSQLRVVRDPDYWKSVAIHADFGFPKTITDQAVATKSSYEALNEAINDGQSPSKAVHWLRKPYAGAGGLHIRSENSGRSTIGRHGPLEYLQERIAGTVFGVHCVIGTQGSSLVGITEALSHSQWPGPSEFIYRGSLGPVVTEVEHERRIHRLCEQVYATSGLRGWVQFDFIANDLGQWWLLEINPRWAAGMELLDRCDFPILQTHAAEFGVVADAPCRNPTVSNSVAKAIFYAESDVSLSRSLLRRLQALPWASDLPDTESLGETILAGHPVLTIGGSLEDGYEADEGGRREHLLQQLHERRREVVDILRDG